MKRREQAEEADLTPEEVDANGAGEAFVRHLRDREPEQAERSRRRLREIERRRSERPE